MDLPEERIRKSLPRPKSTADMLRTVQGMTFQWIPNLTLQAKGYWRRVR